MLTVKPENSGSAEAGFRLLGTMLGAKFADIMIDQIVNPATLVTMLREQKTTHPDFSIDPLRSVTWAFFDGPTRFLVRVQNNQSEPVTFMMSLQGFTWKVSRFVFSPKQISDLARSIERRQPQRKEAPPTMPPTMPPQTAAMPAPRRPPAPVVSASYSAALSTWLASHKHYPESARERGEEGRAVLRFRVARSGRVLSYAVVQSTGHPDLDAAIDRMMQGASLPPFPADMTAADVEVSVAIRFALAP